MKKYFWLVLMIPFLWIWAWCENKIIQTPEIEKSELVEFCEVNGWFIWWTDELVCYFTNSSCMAKDFYNWDCLPQEELESLYDEELAELYCEKSYWTISEVDIWWEKEKICLFHNQSVCSLKDIFYWECNIEN